MWKDGESTQDSPNTDPGGRRWRRGNGDIRDIIPVGTEFGGVPGIQVAGEGKNLGRLMEHFIYRHWKSKVEIIKEEKKPLPRCNHCGMHMTVDRLMKQRRAARCEKAK